MSDFVRIGEYGDFREGKGRAVEVGGKKVAVFKLRGELFAISDACPHMGASLADGRLEGTKVICHWHAWAFDLHSGRTREREWACANVYTVERRGDDVWVKPPPPPPAKPEPEPEPWVVFDPDKHFRKKG